MGKHRKLADKLTHLRAKRTITKPNPFEIKTSRQKLQALGRRLDRGEKGAPLASHAKAVKQRQDTLLKEYRRFGKKNRLYDRRLGEHRKGLDKQEKMAMRFALERRRLYSQKGANDLGDEELLTHRGHTLADVDKFDRPASSDDDDEDEQNAGDKLSADFVKSAHFVTGNGAEDSRKTLIQSIVEKSKAVKLERQLQRDKVEVLTEQLDKQWKKVLENNLLHRFVKPSKAEQTAVAQRHQVDDYDRLLREMQLGGRRSRAVEKTRTPEAAARFDLERLESLEEERTKTTSDTWNRAAGRENSCEDADRSSENAPHLSLCSSTDDLENQLSEPDDPTVDPVFRNYDGIPFVFEMPKSYDDFLSLVSPHGVKIQSVVLRRLIKCYHPSLHVDNHKRLCNLLLYSLRYFESVVAKAFDFPRLNSLAMVLRLLSRMEPGHAVKCAETLLTRYQTNLGHFKNTFPDFSCFAFLRLLPRLFAARDSPGEAVLNHAVHFMSEALSNARVRSQNDVIKSLLLMTTLLEYLETSKLYVPELIVSLVNILQLALSKNATDLESHFVMSGGTRGPTAVCLLLIEKPFSRTEEEIDVSIPDAFSSALLENEDRFKVLSLSLIVQLLNQLMSLWSHLASAPEVFAPVLGLLRLLPRENYPPRLKADIDELLERLSTVKRSAPVASVKTCFKPEAKEFKFKEPLFEPKFNPERRKTVKGKLAEKKDLARKYKRELRGALRELRRDGQFIARQQAAETRQLDEERERKTKLIMRSLVEQETEYKKSKRTK